MTHPRARRLAVGLLFLAGPAMAADHAEAPGTQADPHADIGDFYAWHTDGGRFVSIITFATLGNTTTGPNLDPDVLYGIHIDRDLDNVADADIWVRFGQNADGDWGLLVQGAPGASGDIVGPVGELVEQDGIKVWVGHSDDPFFFDLAGFQDTLSTGTISFTTADALAGLNATSLVIELDTAAATDGASFVQVWSTTGRK